MMNDLRIKVAKDASDLAEVYRIRYLVFQLEQAVDPALEFDDKEAESQHILAYWKDEPVGTARFRKLNSQTGKVERVAVLAPARGRGIGKKIMEKALEVLATEGVSEVQINAQEPVRDFYQKLGFKPEGAMFEEAGIPHVKMRKLLR